MSEVTSLSVREFSQAIINFVKSSPIPWEVKRMCLADALCRAETEAVAEIKREIAERDALEQKNAEVAPVQPDSVGETVDSPVECEEVKDNGTE